MARFNRSPVGSNNPNCVFHIWYTAGQAFPSKVRLLQCDRCNAVIIDRVTADGPIIDEDDWPKNWILEYIKPW